AEGARGPLRRRISAGADGLLEDRAALHQSSHDQEGAGDELAEVKMRLRRPVFVILRCPRITTHALHFASACAGLEGCGLRIATRRIVHPPEGPSAFEARPAEEARRAPQADGDTVVVAAAGACVNSIVKRIRVAGDGPFEDSPNQPAALARGGRACV